jgi:predicted transcriptional regulator
MNKERLQILLNSCSFDAYEQDLFCWYVKETEDIIEGMLDMEQKYLSEQVQSGIEDINDSGFVAIEYHINRIRYSHVIYMVSILEVFLERECERLASAIGPSAITFGLNEIKGDQWSAKKKFLERYGRFVVPEEVWNGAISVTTLRNVLVHDNGFVAKIPEKDRRKLASITGLSFDNTQIVIDSKFIWYGLEKIKDLAKFVESEVAAIVNRAIKPQLVP